MAVYLDDFDTGAASALGSLWTSGGGYAVSADGYAYTVDTRNPAAVFATAPSGADQFVERKFANNNGVSFGVITRATLSGNSVQRGYLARHNGSGIAIFRAVGGNFTQLAQGSHTRASGQTMRMESIGSQHTVYMDGVQIVTVTDSNYPSGGSVGMRDGGTADSRIDSMRGGDYGVSFSGTLSLSGSGTSTANGTPAVANVLPLLGSGDTASSGSPSVGSGLPLSGSGSSSSGATPSASGSLTASGTGFTSIIGKPTFTASAPLFGVGTSTFTGAGTIRAAGRLDLSGSGQLQRSGTPGVAGAAALTSSGSITPAGSPRFGGALYLDADGQLVLVGVGEQVPVGFTPYVVPVDVEDGSTVTASVTGHHRTEVFV